MKNKVNMGVIQAKITKHCHDKKTSEANNNQLNRETIGTSKESFENRFSYAVES